MSVQQQSFLRIDTIEQAPTGVRISYYLTLAAIVEIIIMLVGLLADLLPRIDHIRIAKGNIVPR